MATRSTLGPNRDRTKAAELIKRLAGNFPGDTIEERIARAAEALGWKLSRAENIWRGEARRIDAWEMDALRAVSRNHRRRRLRTRKKTKL